MPYLYKYVPADVAIVFLQKGLSFSRPSDFADKNEFHTRFIPIRVHEFLAAMQEYKKFRQNPAWLHRLPPDEQFWWYSRNHPEVSPKSKKQIRAIVDRVNATQKNVSSEKLKQQLNARFRICSLTTWEDSEKMWREYAGDSTGVKFTFQTKALVNSEYGTLRPVAYSPKLPCYNPAYFSRDGEHLLRVIYTKLDSFADESEVRLCVDLWRPQISALHGLYMSETRGEQNRQKEYLYYRPIQECLSAVTFGRNCPKVTKEKITSLLNQLPDTDSCMQLCERLRELLLGLEASPLFHHASPQELAESMPTYAMQGYNEGPDNLVTAWKIMNQLKCLLAPGDDEVLLRCLQEASWKEHTLQIVNRPRFKNVQIIQL